VLFLHFVEVGIGKFSGKFGGEIECGDNGNVWVYTGFQGEIFISLHIIAAMIASGVARAVLIKTVREIGFFAELVEESESEEEITENKTDN